MNIFNVITLFGGLAMFLYGMRMMGDGLKASSSGPLKKAMERITGTPLKAFLLGLGVTAVIQSSKATIVLTSGLVGTGIISLHQSLGIIIGANVGTTVTGQIIRLLDLNASGAWFLKFFQPSSLAPLALIIGSLVIAGMKSRDSGKIGHIIVGFGILFTGLLNMTDAVSVLSDSGIVEQLFSRLGQNPLLACLMGAGVAFVLQSSSATVGILQAFSTSGQLTFGEIYAMLVGIYLGDCLTTAIVCGIGARPDAKRVGVVNVLFNVCKSVLIMAVITIIHRAGLLDAIWDKAIYSGGIANAHTIFNLACAFVLLPFVGVYESISHRLVKEEPAAAGKYDEMLDALNPVFISTPAMAFGRCYDVFLVMFQLAKTNISRACAMFTQYDGEVMKQIEEDEAYIDTMADRVSNYLIQISAAITSHYHVEIMNYYFSAITEFERLGDHALNIAEIAAELHEKDNPFSKEALEDLAVLWQLLETILVHTGEAFRKQNLAEARRIEPLEQVVDDMVNVLKEHHLDRLRKGECDVFNGSEFFNLLSEAARISDVCSNVGVATVARGIPGMNHQIHNYISMLHSGGDEEFNQVYQEAHEEYFKRLMLQPDKT